MYMCGATEVDDEVLASADANIEVAGGKITPATKKEKAEITALVDEWELNTLDKHLKQVYYIRA